MEARRSSAAPLPSNAFGLSDVEVRAAEVSVDVRVGGWVSTLSYE